MIETTGPRASVLVDDGRAYSLGSMGHLWCLDAADGTVIWRRDLHTDYKIRMPNWGIAAAPLIEAGLLILQIGGQDDACLIALDKRTGQERWKALSDDASYAAPIVVDQAGHRVLVCRTGNRVVGLDPTAGRRSTSHGSGGPSASPRQSATRTCCWYRNRTKALCCCGLRRTA